MEKNKFNRTMASFAKIKDELTPEFLTAKERAMEEVKTHFLTERNNRVMEILTAHLKRVPTTEEFNSTIVHGTEFGKLDVFYDDTRIGLIEFKMIGVNTEPNFLTNTLTIEWKTFICCS